jgi:hypothetical protein
MIFLLLNLIILITSIVVTLKVFILYQFFLDAPLVYKLLIGLGLVTPLANIYDGIKNFIMVNSYLDSIKKDE